MKHRSPGGGWPQIAEPLFRYRYAIAGLLFLLCVLLGLTGSSVGCWTQFLGTEEWGVLLGQSRPIRSDEWAVSTPMLWSQYRGAEFFPYFSHAVRGCATDVFTEYGQPVASLLMLFRPFYLGYLFLPLSQGMAFFWCGRLIGLFMASFEFGRLLTDDRRGLSALYALCISLAPAVQWWFAVCGLVEMLICSQASVVLLRLFMRTEDRKKRAAAALGITVCAGTYILTFYPAWQIPIFYVLLGCLLWVLWDNCRSCSMRPADWLLIGGCALLLAALLGRFYLLSRETIRSILGTIYPGQRAIPGGGDGRHLFEYIANIWLGLRGQVPYYNLCEVSRFLDLFPLCWLLPPAAMACQRRRDPLLVILLPVSLLLFLYILVGLPMPLARVTLLSMSSTGRAAVAFGFCNVMLIFRSLSLLIAAETKLPFFGAGAAGVITACAAILGCRQFFGDYLSPKVLAATALVFCSLHCGCLLIQRREIRSLLAVALAGTMVIAGGTVNPIRSGVADVTSIPAIENLSLYSKEDTLWVAEGVGFPMMNLPLMAGLPTVNSTNVYPALERWQRFDPDGSYAEHYNRYAHITVQLMGEGEHRPSIEAGATPDQFTANFTVEDLKGLQVTHVLSNRDLTLYGLSFAEEIGAGLMVFTLP